MATWSYRFAILFFNNIYLASSGLSFVSQDICCIMWDLLLWHMDSLVVAHRLSSWDAWAWLLHSLWDLSSLTRGWTHISCTARQILNHWKVKVLVAQSCPTLYYPIYYSPSCSSVHGVLQARLLEWVAISFSKAWKWKVKVKSLSHAWLLATPRTAAYQAPPSMGFSRQEYWSGVPLPSPYCG